MSDYVSLSSVLVLGSESRRVRANMDNIGVGIKPATWPVQFPLDLEVGLG